MREDNEGRFGRDESTGDSLDMRQNERRSLLAPLTAYPVSLSIVAEAAIYTGSLHQRVKGVAELLWILV